MSGTRTATTRWLGVVLTLLLVPRAAFTDPVCVGVPTDLGTLGTPPGGSARDINAAGQVVGVILAPNGNSNGSISHGFIWSAASGMVDLGSLGGTWSEASAINDAGQVVGRSAATDGQPHAFTWTAVGGWVDIGLGSADDVNDAGQVVGYFQVASGQFHAFVWTAAGGLVDLGTLGGTQSFASGINDAGQVVGQSDTAGGSRHAFVWTAAGGMVDLGTLGGTSSFANAINNAGEVVGQFQTAGGQFRAFLWTAAGGMVNLGTLGGTSSFANDINNAGQVAGSSSASNGVGHAFVWTAATGMVDIATLSAASQPSTAGAINDAGQIVGQAAIFYQNLLPDMHHPVLWELSCQEPLAVTTLTSSVAFPVVAGTLVTWTASATGGIPPYTFQFWVFDGSKWSLGRDWSASPNWTWEPALPGSYTVQVRARHAGSSAEYNALRDAVATIATPSVLTITTVRPSAASVPAGTTVIWSVTAAGGTGPYTYKFLVYDGTTWTLGRDWGAVDYWSWTPANPGTYALQVWARNAGSSTAYDAWRAVGAYTATRPASPTVTALTADPAMWAPALIPLTPVQTPVTWRAVGAGGTGPYTYKFFVYDGTTWTVGRDWSANNTWTWLPTAEGGTQVQVWMRNAGSTAPYDAWAPRYFWVMGPVDLQVGLAANRMFPVPTGTPVTWTARGSGGAGPYTYKFLVFDGATWSVGHDWSASERWTWVPPSTGTYKVQVWVRNAGSANPYDAWAGTPAFNVSSPTALAVTTTVAPMAPLFTGEPATVTATATGGTGPYTYQFWVYDGSAWTLGQQWGPSSTYAWSAPAAGTYWILTFVRNVGTTSFWDAGQGLGPLTILP